MLLIERITIYSDYNQTRKNYVMSYEYRKDAVTSKTLQAKKQPGLPKDIKLDFSSIHIRVYKTNGYQGYFNCSLAIPSHQDDEEYVLELPFSDSNTSESLDVNSESNFDYSIEGTDFVESFENHFRYDAPLHEHSFDSVIKSMACQFEDKTEQDRRMLLFNLSIKGTPFNGYVLIDEELYGYA
jgi:hypothetical protein